MSGFVLGIDAGGTQLRALIFDPIHQRIVERLELAAASDGGPEPLGPLLSGKHDTIDSICAGITKVSRGEVKAHWERALQSWFPQAAVQVLPDFVIAFHGALPSQAGIMVVAGTGSVVYGEDGFGKSVRVGGRGWEYGDEGSGAHLTETLLRRSLRACDGLGSRTPLILQVCEALGTTEAGALAETARQRARLEGRGFLVPLVLAQAQAGQLEAQELFVGEAGWLARLVRAAHTQMQLSTEAPFAVTTVGGLWEAGSLLREPFEQVLRRWLPQLQFPLPVATPVEGAVWLAARAAPPNPTTR